MKDKNAFMSCILSVVKFHSESSGISAFFIIALRIAVGNGKPGKTFRIFHRMGKTGTQISTVDNVLVRYYITGNDREMRR